MTGTHSLAVGSTTIAVIIIAAAIGCRQTVPAYPHWELEEPRIDCHDGIEIDAWFARSGKEGAGLVVHLRDTTDRSRTASLERARLLIRPADDPVGEPSLEIESEDVAPVEFEDRDSMYVPFLFNNNRAWNRGLRAGTVDIELFIDDSPTTLTRRANHRDAEWSETYTGRLVLHPHADDDPPPSDMSRKDSDGNIRYLMPGPDDSEGYRVLLDIEPSGGCPGDDDD